MAVCEAYDSSSEWEHGTNKYEFLEPGTQTSGEISIPSTILGGANISLKTIANPETNIELNARGIATFDGSVYLHCDF